METVTIPNAVYKTFSLKQARKKKHVEVWRQGGMVGKENVVDSGGKHATESLYSILTIVLKIDYNLILSLSPLHYQKHATNS